MKLVEIIPGTADERRGRVQDRRAFSISGSAKASFRQKTGRILSPTASASFGMMATVHEMLEMGFTPTEVDQITGKAIGHASSATFRTSDLVGLDVLAHVNKNLYPAVPDDEDRDVFQVPDVIKTMLEKKLLGDKTEGGFYKKSKDAEGKRMILELDLEHLRIQAAGEDKIPFARRRKGDRRHCQTRMKTLVWGDDQVGEFLWKTMSRTFRVTPRTAFPRSPTRSSRSTTRSSGALAGRSAFLRRGTRSALRESVERMRDGGPGRSRRMSRRCSPRVRPPFTKTKTAKRRFTISSAANTNRFRSVRA